jgi:TIR domain
MATGDTESAREQFDPSEGVVYDGFISYSHAADDLLAPRLQDGLQRFAKPWWKRRALRMFRDESSLSANPHLWSSITDALDGSAWFVLLLSPEAAQSPWVDNEVEYWLERKDPGRIIPVLTDGDFAWLDGDPRPFGRQGRRRRRRRPGARLHR